MRTKPLSVKGYLATSDGRIWSQKSNRFMAFTVAHHGYLRVQLYVDGYRINRFVHRLVLEAFLGPPPSDDHEVNHKNNCKGDNRIENLEWVTKSQNCKQRYKDSGQNFRGEGSFTSKLCNDEVLEIRRCKGIHTAKLLALRFNVSKHTIEAIWQRRRWNHL